jgi:hypothetical protein
MDELWHSAALSMLARLTRWLLAMMHATFDVYFGLMLQLGRVYDWI